jgi:hypothetical protein
MVAKGVTDIVKTHGMRKLRMDETDHMAPRIKTTALLVHFILPRKLRDKMPGDEFANLLQDAKLMPGCFFP